MLLINIFKLQLIICIIYFILLINVLNHFSRQSVFDHAFAQYQVSQFRLSWFTYWVEKWSRSYSLRLGCPFPLKNNDRSSRNSFRHDTEPVFKTRTKHSRRLRSRPTNKPSLRQRTKSTSPISLRTSRNKLQRRRLRSN